MAAEVAFAFGKLVLWATVLLYLLPKKLFPQAGRRDPAGAALRFAVGLALIAQTLALLRILDRLSFGISLLVWAGIVLWRSSGRPITDLAWSAIDAAHVLLYDLLDSGRLGWQWIRDAATAQMHRARRHLIASAAPLRHHPEMSALVLAYLTAHGLLLALDPRFVALRQYADLAAFKAFAAHRPLEAPAQPWGIFALSYAIHSVALIPEDWLLRGISLLLPAAAALAAYRVVLRHGHLRRPGALISASLLLGAPALWPPDSAIGQASLGPEMAAGIVIAVAWMGAVATRPDPTGRRRPLGAVFWVSLLAALLAPLAWASLVVLAVASLLVDRVGATNAARPGPRAVSLWPVLLGGVPAVAQVVLVAFYQQGEVLSALGVDSLGLLFEPCPPVLQVFAGAALLVALWPGPLLTRRVPAAVGLSLLLLPGLLGRWPLAHASRWAPLLLPLGAIFVGVAVNLLLSAVWRRVRARQRLRALRRPRASLAFRALSAASAVSLLACTAPAAHPTRRWESLEGYRVLHRLRRDTLAREWTLVDTYRRQPLVLGRGWVLSREDFLRKYRPGTYRWDPRYPEQTVPTRHVYLFVEQKLPADVHPRGLGLPTERLRASQQLEAWCRAYAAHGGAIRRIYDSRTLRVYDIYRSQQTERAILRRIWKESH